MLNKSSRLITNKSSVGPAVRGQRVSDVPEADRRVGRREASEGGWGFAEVGGEEGQGDRV